MNIGERRVKLLSLAAAAALVVLVVSALAVSMVSPNSLPWLTEQLTGNRPVSTLQSSAQPACVLEHGCQVRIVEVKVLSDGQVVSSQLPPGVELKDTKPKAKSIKVVELKSIDPTHTVFLGAFEDMAGIKPAAFPARLWYGEIVYLQFQVYP